MTDNRQVALNAAVFYMSQKGTSFTRTQEIIDMAESFCAWLNKEEPR